MPTGKHHNHCRTRVNDAEGFTYIAIMIAVVIMGIFLSGTGLVWHTAQQREREQQLLFVGDQFRQAIGRYYNVGGVVGAAGQYPQSLDDLLKDPRLQSVEHYLRKIYFDPMTGSQEWGLIKNSDGRIIGVHSLSDDRPIKQINFPLADKDFEGMEKYSQWTFIYSRKPNRPTLRAKSVTPADTHSGAL